MITLEAKWDDRQKNILMSRLATVTRMVYYYIQPPGELPKQLSIKYVELARQYLLLFRRGGDMGYKAYNPDYAKWKKQYGKLSGFWNLMGDLFENVKSSRARDGYFGGVVSTVMDRGGKSWYGKGNRGEPKSIAMYGTVMEEGLAGGKAGVHPARPLFRPVLEKFAYSKSRATAGLAWSICDSALMKIGDAWKK